MRRWVHSVASALLRTGALRASQRRVPGIIRERTSLERKHLHDRERQLFDFRWKIFDHHKHPGPRPRDNPQPWVALLDSALPPHLRVNGDDRCHPSIGAEGLAEILLAAQHAGKLHRDRQPGSLSSVNLDLLEYIALEQGRWDAVIYLVKQLVDAYAGGIQPRQIEVPAYIDSPSSLRALTHDGPINLSLDPRPIPTDFQSLHLRDQTQALSDGHGGLSHDGLFAKRALGQVWRSLGRIVVSRAEEGVPPEALEIIAYLHHQGIMPISIYNSRPGSDPTAIQQPPLLYMFSSRILASLSDAAWRAHEKIIVEEAKAKGGSYSSMRPEIPGMAYRVRVASLRPEVWLELILWSCLHGGWTLEGLDIVIGICKSRGAAPWKPLSWRMMSGDMGETPDWDKLHQRLTVDGLDMFDVKKTISAEVVNAYIDALLTLLHDNPDKRGISTARAVYRLSTMRGFLWRGGLNNVAGGSWDVVTARLFESQGHEYFHSPRGLIILKKLSAPFGHEMANEDARHQPPYILDRSSAVLGIYHRALRAKIRAGDLEQAFSVLHLLLNYTDRSKARAAFGFFEKLKLGSLEADSLDHDGRAIEYPAFDAQIPSGILASMLELILDSKSYHTAATLLFDEPLAGAIIPRRLYGVDELLPQLLRFAAETDNKSLLSDLLAIQAEKNGDSPPTVAHTFVQFQMRAQNWTAVERTLVYIRDSTKDMHWGMHSLVVLAYVMISSQGAAPEQAKKLFQQLVRGVYDSEPRPQPLDNQISTLLVILASINSHWAEFIASVRPLPEAVRFSLDVRDFHLIVEAVAKGFGSREGRKLVDRFWHPDLQRAQRRINKRRLQPSSEVDRQRTTVSPNTVVYGGPHIISRMFKVILHEFAKELRLARIDESLGISQQLSAAVSEYMVEVHQFGAETARARLATVSSSLGMIHWLMQMPTKMAPPRVQMRTSEAIRAFQETLLPVEMVALEPYLVSTPNLKESWEKSREHDLASIDQMGT